MKKISVPIYKMFFDKNFLNRIEKVNKNHLLTQSTHFAYYTKQGESFVLTSYDKSRNIVFFNQPVVLKPYKISDYNILNEPIAQYFNSPGYLLNDILDYDKIKIYFDRNPDNIIEKIENYLAKNEQNMLETIKKIKEKEGVIVIDKDTKKLEYAYNFRKKNE
jgi:hypothetical protein